MAYQRKFTRTFAAAAPKDIDVHAEPWFAYSESSLPSHVRSCCPDLIAIDKENKFVIVIEVKSTWTPLAMEKLREVYCPVVQRALGFPTKPLVVCKTLIPISPRPQPTISFSLISETPLYHWTGRGPIQW